MSEFVALPTLATITRVSRQALEKRLGEIIRGEAQSWRGAAIQFRHARGRGGRSGLRYEIRVDSLPPDLQQRLKDQLNRPTPTQIGERTDNRGAERNWYLRVLGPLLAMKRGKDRAAAIETLAARTDLTDWRGQPIVLSGRSIHRWLKKYHDEGALAFAPRARTDKGTLKVIISLAAEQAIPFDIEIWERIATDLRNYIRGHWKEGATLKLIRGRTNIKFRKLIEAAGFEHCHTLPDSTFIVPRRFIEAERRFRHVHTLNRDRKRYEDNRFRIKRSRAGMMPMDIVNGDVHPVDIVMTREDGTTAHARMIAWLDIATNRMFFDLVLCEAGTGIRNADLIQSFLRMVAAWGLPKTLYIDNGREYSFADNIEDALQLVAQLRGDDGRNCVVHALPYNASAKPIEGMFGGLERMLQDIPGHTGGDRMNKKTERVGHPTKAFPGTLAQLAAIIQGRVTEKETYPMRGDMAGRSPRQAYQAALDSGWQPVAVDPREILVVFSTDRVCTIAKGVITYDSRRWFCDELSGYFEDKIIARVPRFWRAEKLPLLHIKTRELVGIAEPTPTFAFDDPAGARFSKKVDVARRKAIRALDRSTPDIDTVQEGLRIAAMIPPPPAVAPIATLSVSDEAKQIASIQLESREDRAARQHDKSEREHRKRLAILERAAKKGA